MINVIQLVAAIVAITVVVLAERRKKQQEVKLYDVRMFTAFPFAKQHVTQFAKCISLDAHCRRCVCVCARARAS